MVDNYGNLVKFDSNGDGVGHYNLYNYAQAPGSSTYDFRRVGEYRNGHLGLVGDISWPGDQIELPRSMCSEPCGVGQVRKYNKKDQKCCWICDACSENQFMKNETTCEVCPTGWWPNKDKNSCYQLEIHYMKLTSWFAIGPMCLSALGIISTCFVIITFIRYNDTPIVRASGRELSYLLLTGCLTCFLMSFILLLKPSGVICAFQRVGIGFGFAMMYSSLLTKTNRISRIFESANKSAKRPPFISPKSQLIISAILISVQLLCTLIWLILSPPGTRLDSIKSNFPILRCKIDDRAFLVSLVYNMFLIIVCTIYAVKTRRIPENFNESKFIGFTMYTTCIIWLAFVPIYFGTLHTFEVQTTTLCVSISLSSTVTLVCLFAPKLHVIFFQPEKNVRKLTMNSTQQKKQSSAGSFGNHQDITLDYSFTAIPSSSPAVDQQPEPPQLNSSGCASIFKRQKKTTSPPPPPINVVVNNKQDYIEEQTSIVTSL